MDWTFQSDIRAIEGLPIRLVIALIVGVASLGVMMSMISGISGLAVIELDVQPDPPVVEPGDQTIAVKVIDPDGNGVTGATVIARSGSATLGGIASAQSGPDGIAELNIDPQLGPNQYDGTVVFEIHPPAGSEYVDKRENTALLVIR